MEKSRQPYIFALLAVLFWSTIPTAFKICLRNLGILPMLTIASLTSATILFIILTAEGKTDLIKQTTGRQLLGSALLGLINPFIYYIILFPLII